MRDRFEISRAFRDAIKTLEPMDQAMLYNALCDYALDGIGPELNGALMAVFMLMRPTIDDSNKRRENGKKGGRPKTKENHEETKEEPNENQTVTEVKPNRNQTETTTTEKEKEKVTQKEKVKDIKEKDTLKGIQKERFTPPSVDEVRAYVSEYARTSGRMPISAEKFCDFYESKGWMVGKNRMKDWKAAVRNWMNNNEATPSKGSVVNFKQRSDNYSEMLMEGNW